MFSYTNKGYSQVKLQNGMKNIESTISKTRLNNLYLQIAKMETTLEQVAELYDLDLQALAVLYTKYLKSITPKIENPKPKTAVKKLSHQGDNDMFYDTKSMITNLVVRNIGNKKYQLVIEYIDQPIKTIEGTDTEIRKQRRLYKQKIYSDGKKLVETMEKNKTRHGGIGVKGISKNEKLLSSKWKLYLNMSNINKSVETYAKANDQYAYEDVMKEKVITYKKLNSLTYTLKELKEDCCILETYYENRIEKQLK